MRATSGAAALIVIAAAAFFVIRSEKEIAAIAGSIRAFDRDAREVAVTFSELRAGQEAYVAAGQGNGFWIPKVASTIQHARAGVKSLRLSARSGPGRQALMEAEATIADLETIDRRVRDYLTAGDRLMAADVIFAEAGKRADTGGRQVETARIAERQAADVDEAGLRRRQAAILAAAAALVAALVVVLVRVRRTPISTPLPARVEATAAAAETPDRLQSLAFLKTAADLCTEFGRIRDVDDLKRLLAQAADAIGAKGLIVWLGSAAGIDLQPVVAHGYSADVVARMPRLRRAGDNAAAAACRTGVQQIVLSRPGRMCGGIVAPIVGVDGCVGALSIELPEGTEGSEPVQMLATIIAAQVAGLVSTDVIAECGMRIAE